MNSNLKYRLETAERSAAQYTDSRWVGGTWQYWIKRGVKGKATMPSVGKDGQWFTDDKNAIGKFIELNVGRNRDCTGYYADNFQDSIIKFGVSKLHTSKGTYYIPVTWNTDADGATHYMTDKVLVLKTEVSDEDHEAAYKEALRYADRCAELEAEESREYDAKFQAEQQIREAQETIKESRLKIRALIAELRGITLPNNICKNLKNSIKQMRAESRTAYERIQVLRDNYWLAVDGF